MRFRKQYQLVKNTNSSRLDLAKLTIIPIWGQFYKVALDIVSPLLETKLGNMYVLVAIDHYSKWCEAKAMVDYVAKIAIKFMEDEIIYRFGVPKYVLIDNGSKWFADFDQLCKNYGIVHQYTTPQWPRCNEMVERLVKTLKHGFIILFTNLEHTQDWDKHLPMVLLGYRCGVQFSTKFFPHMLLIGITPRLKVDNFLSP